MSEAMYDERLVAKDLKLEAKALGIPVGAAESFIDLTIKALKKNLKGKKIITDKDLERAIVKELKKYNGDLAYVYKNRDTII